MLGTRNAIANLAVRDIDRAKDFYTGKLGLEEVDNEGDDFLVLRSGDSVVNVYCSEYAGTNEATAVSWQVDDIAREVADLKRKGVAFEHYDLPGLERDGDLHVADDYKLAWFKDPDGNILHLIGD